MLNTNFLRKKGGFINTKGELVLKVNVFIEAPFEENFNDDELDVFFECVQFGNGVVLLNNHENLSYLIDKDGRKIGKAKFLYDCESFNNDGVMATRDENRNNISINNSGEILFKSEGPVYVDSDNGYYAIKKNGKYGFVNLKGELLIDYCFDDVRQFCNGFAPIRIGDKWGFIDETGKIIIAPIYDRVWLFGEGLAPVQINRKWGYIDKSGDIKISIDYDSAQSFKNGFARVSTRFGYTLINTKGEEVIPYFDFIDNEFICDLLRVKKNNKWGIINLKGDFIVKPEFDFITIEPDGNIIANSNGVFGKITTEGECTFFPKFDYVGLFENKLGLAKYNGKWGCINTDWEFVIPPKYEYTRGFSNGLAFILLEDGLWEERVHNHFVRATEIHVTDEDVVKLRSLTQQEITTFPQRVTLQFVIKNSEYFLDFLNLKIVDPYMDSLLETQPSKELFDEYLNSDLSFEIDKFMDYLYTEGYFSYYDFEPRPRIWKYVKKIATEYYYKNFNDIYGALFTDINSLSLAEIVEGFIKSELIESDDADTVAIFTYYLIALEKFPEDVINDYYGCYKIVQKECDKVTEVLKADSYETGLFEGTTLTISDVDLLTGHEFEFFIAALFNKMGYNAEVTKGSGDQGIDVIVKTNGSAIYGIQTKKQKNSVTNKAIQEVVAGLGFYNLKKGMVITNNYFNEHAKQLAKANNIQLWDREELKLRIREHRLTREDLKYELNQLFL